MENRLIMLPQPILVSDEEVNPHNAVWDFENNQVTVLRQSYGLTNYKKIVAGLPDLPKLDLSLIAKGIGWVDVEKLALKEYPKDLHRWAENQFDDFNESDRNTWINGFKAAQSLNEKKYSEEDMIEFAHFCRDYFTHLLTINEKFNLWLSNRKPKEYLVEVEMEVNQCDGCISGHPIIDGIHKAPCPSGSMVCKKHLYDKPKITNNTIKVTKILH